MTLGSLIHRQRSQGRVQETTYIDLALSHTMVYFGPIPYEMPMFDTEISWADTGADIDLFSI